MKNTLIYFSLIIVLILGPTACDLFQSCPEVLPFFKIEGMDVNHYRFNDDPFGDPIVENAKIPWQEYGLRADFRTSYYAANEGLPGGSMLYALSCAEDGYQGSEVGVDTLYLVALDNYNGNYVKNDTLNEILLVNDYFNGVDYTSLADYLLDNRESVRLESLTLKLSEGPSQDTALGFELIYVLKSGEEFKQTSSIVNLRE